jgi:small ligand-binding sensory domain FIST
MPAHAAISTHPETPRAIDEIVRSLKASQADSWDLAFIFASPDHLDGLADIGRKIVDDAIARHAIGSTAQSVIGIDREVEEAPCLAILVINTPGPVHCLQLEDSESLGFDPSSRPGAKVFLFADPFRFDAEEWARKLAAINPSVPIIGGYASASRQAGGNRLLLDREAFDHGAVAVVTDSPVRIVVSQGCRPIGRPLIVTKAEGNVIRELGRRPALDALRQVIDELPPEDRALTQGGIHVGCVINEYQERFDRGDFLVRNILGVDRTGGLAVSDRPRVGQTIQFHVRDAATADEDLRSLLLVDRELQATKPPKAALLITCNGRGRNLFSAPNHDVGAIREFHRSLPVAGFFAMGEFGPIANHNFIHGFTSVIAYFESP